MQVEAVLKKEIIVNKALCRMFGVAVFTALTALGAFVRIPLPFTPVPITLQTFFVLLSGAFLGSNLGAAAQAGYLFLGILGVPLFTGTGSGLLYLSGPTSGYLFGFILASFFLGRTVKYAKGNLFSIFMLFSVADFLLLACGVVWLRILFGYSWPKLFAIGFLPFIPADLLKALLASGIYYKAKPRLDKIF